MSPSCLIVALCQFFAGCAVAALLAWAWPIVRDHWKRAGWEPDEHSRYGGI